MAEIHADRLGKAGHMQSIEEVCSELSMIDAESVIALASACLSGDHHGPPDIVLTRPPTVGSVVTQVREPVAEQRFILADVLACQAEVTLDGHPGWAVRMGSDRLATLAAAVCAAEYAGQRSQADAVLELCRRGRAEREAARAAEWERLAPSIVEFEEIP